MAASQEQKLDYLLKKIGYVASKTGIAEDSSLSGTKKAPFAESIPSPLAIPSSIIWADSSLIPATPPGSSSDYVRVYLSGTSGHRMTVDNTVSGNRSFIAYETYNDTSSGILGDWIDTSFGSDYIIKVYKGDPNSGGVLLSASGSGSNDTWFFDYSSGVLNFNGTQVPSGVTSSNIYIVGYRYIGAKGVKPPAGLATFSSLQVSGITTLNNLMLTGVGTASTIHINDGTATLSSLNVTGVSTFQSNVKLGNNDKIIFGNSDDLEIYHDGNNAYIADTGAGDLKLRGTAAIRLENSAGTETYAQFNVDGASELFYDNSKKIETTNDGVLVSGVTSTTTAKIGAATTFTEDLVVQGDARVTGILTVGTSSIVFDGPNDQIKVGSASTITTTGFNVGESLLHSTGLTVAGVTTIHSSGYDIGSSFLHSTGLEAQNINVSGILTASSLNISGAVDIDLNILGNTFYVAETGSDSNDGDNINKPFLTIAKALTVATDHDVINVSAGIFEETCPLTVPAGVTIKGAGLRATIIKPTDATKTNNVFLLNNASTLEDFTVKDSFYNSSADTGYAFSYATGIAITTRSPYIQRITVLNRGSVLSASDPYGFDTANNPPTSYQAGRGALVDGSKVTANSLEAGMLFNEVTFFTPNQKGIILTNGARSEYLNCFHYFASQAIVGTSGSVGIAGTATTRLKFTNPSVVPSVNDVVKLFEGGSVVAVGTITSYSTPYAEIGGKGSGTFTVGSGTTQDVRFFQSNGTTQTGIASAIALADYTRFGAEMRSVGCAVEYGTQGVVADGIGVKLRLFATNFNHVGSGKDFTNDSTLTVQANEVVETNNGQVSYVSIDQSGDFRVGDAFVVQQETGNVSFAATTYNLETTGQLTVTDGGSNQTVITPTSAEIGDLQLASGTLSSSSGDITINPAGSNETNVTGNLNATGNLTVSGIVTSSELNTGPNGIGIGVSTITGPAEIVIDPAAVGDNTGKVLIKGDLQVDGTETIVNSTTVTVEDKNVVLGSGASNDAAANGGGITLESGQGNKTIRWLDSTDSWTFSEHVDLAATKSYKINGVDVLSSTTLGAGVTQSSLTSVGTLQSLTATGAINSNTAIQVNGISVLDTASGDATALAIALG